MFGIPGKGECDYSAVLELDLSSVEPSVSGPNGRRIASRCRNSKSKFEELLLSPVGENGYNKSKDEIGKRFPATIGSRHNGAQSGGGEQRPETAPVAVHDATSTRIPAWQPRPR